MIEDILPVERQKKRQKAYAQYEAYRQYVDTFMRQEAEKKLGANSLPIQTQIKIITWLNDFGKVLQDIVEGCLGTKVIKTTLQNTQDNRKDHQRQSLIDHRFRQIRRQLDQKKSLNRVVDKIQLT